MGFALSPRRNPGLAVSRTIAVNMAVLVRSFFYISRFGPKQRGRLEPLRAMKNRFGNLDALIIAGGPSASKINPREVARLQKSGHLHVFAMNRFFDSALGRLIIPDFYVLSDPANSPNGYLNSWGNEISQKYPETVLFTPTHWKQQTFALNPPSDKNIFFENRSLEGFGRGTSPLRLRGYLGLTALATMAIADFMGYRKIAIIGLDGTSVFSAEIDKQNRIFLAPHHHEGAGARDPVLVSRRLGENGLYKGTFANASDLFFGEATFHNHLDRFFARKGSFVNLSACGVVTSFPKEEPSVFLAQL